jgi:hypothetical protein
LPRGSPNHALLSLCGTTPGQLEEYGRAPTNERSNVDARHLSSICSIGVRVLGVGPVKNREGFEAARLAASSDLHLDSRYARHLFR